MKKYLSNSRDVNARLNLSKKFNKSRMCQHEGCNKRSSFNLPTEIVGIYCVNHKNENMVDVVSNLCVQEGCNSQPSCNFPTEVKRLYCAIHKKENMINVKNKK